MLLAEALGNDELTEILNRLITKTRMFVALFEPVHDSRCAPSEHEVILAALESRDSSRYVASVMHHLHEIETRVTNNMKTTEPREVIRVLRSFLEKDI